MKIKVRHDAIRYMARAEADVLILELERKDVLLSEGFLRDLMSRAMSKVRAKEVGLCLYLNCDYEFIRRRPSEAMVKYNSQPSRALVCFLSEPYINTWLRRILSSVKDKIAEVNFDYVRYPSAEWCFCPRHIKEYERMNIDVEFLKEIIAKDRNKLVDLYAEDHMDVVMWTHLRRRDVMAAIHRAVELVKDLGMKVSITLPPDVMGVRCGGGLSRLGCLCEYGVSLDAIGSVPDEVHISLPARALIDRALIEQAASFLKLILGEDAHIAVEVSMRSLRDVARIEDILKREGLELVVRCI
ncbi:MAG: hypothetical protein DRN15_07795 [Thermoprotei archaeon]|nr:MAG: hypothetical protein DRN15_07795 [Thermoprotei archaeon]